MKYYTMLQTFNKWLALKVSITLPTPLVEGDEGSYLAHSQTNFIIVHLELFLLFWYIINTISLHWGRYEPSSPSTKGLHSRVKYHRPYNWSPVYLVWIRHLDYKQLTFYLFVHSYSVNQGTQFGSFSLQIKLMFSEQTVLTLYKFGCLYAMLLGSLRFLKFLYKIALSMIRDQKWLKRGPIP